jgi:hypothetical protein
MEIEIPLSVKINVAEEKANINDIVKAIGQVLQETGVHVVEQVLKEWEERIVVALCAGVATVRHRRKGRRGRECQGRKGWIRKGETGRERGFTTLLGEVKLRLKEVKCRGCGARLRPLLGWLGLAPYQREEMGIKEKGIDLAVDLSYRRGSRQLENLRGVKVSRSRLNSWVKGTDVELDISLEDWPKLIYADGTGYHRQDGTGGQVKLVLIRGFSGKVNGVQVYVDRSWEEIGRELKSQLGEERLRGCVLLSDGEEAIEKNLLVEGMEHQRCQWHGWKDLGYMLWAEGMSKEERVVIVSQLRKLTIALPFEEKTAEDEDKEEIRGKLSDVKASLEEMVAYLTSKGYLKASGYLHRAGEKLFTYVEQWLGRGIQVGKTTDIIERTMREIARRAKRIGASWGDLGLLAILKFLLKRYFDKEGYQRQWAHYYNPGACQATLVVSKAVIS